MKNAKRKITIVLIHLLWWGFCILFLVFTTRAVHFGTKRNFTYQHRAEFAKIEKERDDALDKLNCNAKELMKEYRADASKSKRDSILTAKEQLRKEEWFINYDYQTKFQKIVQSAKYVDWSQDVMKWLGWRWFSINKEFQVTPLSFMGGYTKYLKMVEEYEKWKAKKRVTDEKNS